MKEFDQLRVKTFRNLEKKYGLNEFHIFANITHTFIAFKYDQIRKYRDLMVFIRRRIKKFILARKISRP